MRDRALFDLAIDSKLRGCDLVKIKIGTLVAGPTIRERSMVVQQKTGRPVQFEITTDARGSLLAWLERRGGSIDDYAFPSRVNPDGHLSTRQYARLVDEWVTAIDLRPEEYGTHSLRRTMQSELLATDEQSAEHRRAEFAIAVLGIIVCIAASQLCAAFIIMRLVQSLHRTRLAEKMVRMERDALEDRVRERTWDLVQGCASEKHQWA